MVNIFELIEERLNIPVQYGRNKDLIKPPFLIYLGEGTTNITADNKIYNSKNKYSLEFYFEKKKEELETKIENIFNENNIIWEKTEDIFIEKENLFEVVYYI